MDINKIKNQWNDYTDILEKSDYVDIERHVQMALKVGGLIQEIENHQRGFTDYTNTLNQTRRKRDEVKGKLAVALSEIKALKKENDQYKRALKYYADRGFERAKDILSDFEN